MEESKEVRLFIAISKEIEDAMSTGEKKNSRLKQRFTVKHLEP